MSAQPEALRLAEQLEAIGLRGPVVAELRRLVAEVEAQRGTIAQFHHAVAGAGWHPGRTDDLLTDIIRDKGQELRRLHAEVERLSLDSIHTCHAECQRPVCRLTRERDALLEALKEVVAFTGAHGGPYAKARAAIAKAEEA